MYEVGKIYIWQNLAGYYAVLNGTECTVIGPVTRYRNLQLGGLMYAQPTDTQSPTRAGATMVACRGDLRPKDIPSGEQSVRDLFTRVYTQALYLSDHRHQLSAPGVSVPLRTGAPK